jgi:hypothetical protein
LYFRERSIPPHLRLAYRENVEVELDRLKRLVLGMPIADGRKAGIAMGDSLLSAMLNKD